MSIVPFPHYIPTAKVRSNLQETLAHLRGIAKGILDREDPVTLDHRVDAATSHVARVLQSEAHYRAEALREAEAGRNWSWVPSRAVPPVVNDPAAEAMITFMVTMDKATASLVTALQDLVHRGVISGDEDTLWLQYDRLSQVFCLVDKIIETLDTVQALSPVWNLPSDVPTYSHTLQASLYGLLETIRHRMSRVRPVVTGVPQETM